MKGLKVTFPDGDVVVLDDFSGGVLPDSGMIGFHDGPCHGVVETSITKEGFRRVNCRKVTPAQHVCQLDYELRGGRMTDAELMDEVNHLEVE